MKSSAIQNSMSPTSAKLASRQVQRPLKASGEKNTSAMKLKTQAW